MTHVVLSPDGHNRLEFGLDAQGRPAYAVQRKDRPILSPSSLRWYFREGLLDSGFELKQAEHSTRDAEFEILSGKASKGREHWQSLTAELTHPSGIGINLEFRVMNDAVAFRYTCTHPDHDLRLFAEESEFRFAEDADCWSIDLPNFRTSFEGEYPRRKLADLRAGDRKGLPFLVQGTGYALAILEAAVAHGPGMYLTPRPGVPFALQTQLSPRLNDPESTACVHADPSYTSAWRVVLLGESPADLITSTAPLALNPPCAIADTSWIRPGKVTWDWWCGPVLPSANFPVGMNTATFEKFIEFAADHRLEYCMIDGGWYGGTDQGGGEDVRRSVPELDVPYLVDYAAQRGVGILLWLHQADLRRQLDEALDYYSELGVKGLKIDFFDRYDQDVVEYCHEILRKAADRKLLVNFHGIFPSVGWERTYPNLLTSEGVMGAEYNKWSRRVTPEHNLTLPFTRMLCGPMDYTIGVFTHATPDTFEARGHGPMSIGTRAQNLAMFVVYESGFQMVSDTPDAIRGQLGSEFLAEVPATWDETRVLAGSVGKYLVLARRKGSRWFVAGMSAGPMEALPVEFGFLEGPTSATVYRDGPSADREPADCVRESATFAPGEVWHVTLASAGGFVVMLG